MRGNSPQRQGSRTLDAFETRPDLSPMKARFDLSPPPGQADCAVFTENEYRRHPKTVHDITPYAKRLFSVLCMANFPLCGCRCRRTGTAPACHSERLS